MDDLDLVEAQVERVRLDGSGFRLPWCGSGYSRAPLTLVVGARSSVRGVTVRTESLEIISGHLLLR